MQCLGTVAIQRNMLHGMYWSALCLVAQCAESAQLSGWRQTQGADDQLSRQPCSTFEGHPRLLMAVNFRFLPRQPERARDTASMQPAETSGRGGWKAHLLERCSICFEVREKQWTVLHTRKPSPPDLGHEHTALAHACPELAKALSVVGQASPVSERHVTAGLPACARVLILRHGSPGNLQHGSCTQPAADNLRCHAPSQTSKQASSSFSTLAWPPTAVVNSCTNCAAATGDTVSLLSGFRD